MDVASDSSCSAPCKPASFCHGGEVRIVVEGKERSLTTGDTQCSICDAPLKIDSEEKAIQSYCDDRIVCGDCRAVLNSTFKTEGYQVCINVLCRRKWKQLTPRLIPYFCPSCRKLLEARLKPISDSKKHSDIEYLQAVHDFWHSFMHALSQKINASWSYQQLTNDTNSSLSDTMDSFLRSLSCLKVEAENCRNWNSMLVRKKYYRGIVSSKDVTNGLCQLHPECELTEYFKDTKKPLNPNKVYHYFMMDWKDEMRLNEEVRFIAFPNPVITNDKEFLLVICKQLDEEAIANAIAKNWARESKTKKDYKQPQGYGYSYSPQSSTRSQNSPQSRKAYPQSTRKPNKQSRPKYGNDPDGCCTPPKQSRPAPPKSMPTKPKPTEDAYLSRVYSGMQPSSITYIKTPNYFSPPPSYLSSWFFDEFSLSKYEQPPSEPAQHPPSQYQPTLAELSSMKRKSPVPPGLNGFDELMYWSDVKDDVDHEWCEPRNVVLNSSRQRQQVMKLKSNSSSAHSPDLPAVSEEISPDEPVLISC